MLNVSVIGLGAWGSALGMTSYRAGASVTMIGLLADVDGVKKKGHVPSFPEVSFPSEILIDHKHDSLKGADVIVCAVPAQFLRSCLKQLKNLAPQTPLVIASKGIEQSTGYLMGEVVQDVLPNPLAVLSGPNFASEVIKNKPTATTIGCTDLSVGKTIVQAFAHKNFRPYLSSDVVGVQISGAVKNVLAIGCGMVRAKGLGENAVASLITRGLHEIKTFGMAKGAKEPTFLGLSGVGDVVLTCMGTQSRNFQFGFNLAQKDYVDVESLKTLMVEGFYTAEALQKVIEKMNIQMPICTMIYEILYKGKKIEDAMETLLTRPLKGEGLL